MGIDLNSAWKRVAIVPVCAVAFGLTPAWHTSAAADELTIALSSFAEQTMTPWGGTGPQKAYLDLVYEYLTYLDPKTQKAIPGLATSWETSADGKTWTFHLREGVTFSGGKGEMTSDDVAYSIQRLIQADSRAGPATAMRRAIASVETPDKKTVVVKLNYPDFELAQGYFGASQQLGIVSKSYVEGVGKERADAEPVGTGPYVLKRNVRGLEIDMTRRTDLKDHWRVTPEFDTVVFKLVPEEATRVAMLKTGEADIAPVSFESVPALRSEGFKIVSGKATWSPVVRFGGLIQTVPGRYEPKNPWAKREVRQALNYAIDKQTIIKEIFKGEATVAAGETPVPAWNSLEPYPYDPAKAKELLAKAGYPKGFDLTLRTFPISPGSELPLIAEAVALYWQEIGVNVKIEPTDWSAVRTEWTEGRTKSYVFTHRGLPFSSPKNGLEAVYVDSSAFATFTSAELGEMIERLSNETDAQARDAQLRKIGQYLRDEAAGVFIALANEPYGVSAKVGDWEIASAYVWNFDRVQRAKPK